MIYSATALFIAVVGGALGQLLLKAGMQNLPIGVWQAAVNELASSPETLGYLVSGISIYVLSMWAWIIALKRFDLGFAYPILALGYLVVYLGASHWQALDESTSWHKTIGLLLIVLGVALSSQQSTFKEQDEG